MRVLIAAALQVPVGAEFVTQLPPVQRYEFLRLIRWSARRTRKTTWSMPRWRWSQSATRFLGCLQHDTDIIRALQKLYPESTRGMRE